MSSSDDKIDGRGQTHSDLGGKPGEGIKNVLTAGVPHPNGVASVGVESRASVPAVRGMCRPRSAVAGFLVCKDAGARRSKGGTVVVEETVKLGTGRELQIQTGTA